MTDASAIILFYWNLTVGILKLLKIRVLRSDTLTYGRIFYGGFYDMTLISRKSLKKNKVNIFYWQPFELK